MSGVGRGEKAQTPDKARHGLPSPGGGLWGPLDAGKRGFQTLVAAQAAKKGGGHLAALSWQNLWLSSCLGLFMRTLCNKSLVFWN